MALPALTFGVLYLWPLIDRRLTGDRAAHHITQRPREVPLRTAIGVAALTFYAVLLLAAGEELIVQWTGLTIAAVRDTLRVVVLVLPVLTGLVAHRVASRLRRTSAPSMLQLEVTDVAGEPPAPGDAEAHEVDPDRLSEAPFWLRAGAGATEGEGVGE